MKAHYKHKAEADDGFVNVVMNAGYLEYDYVDASDCESILINTALSMGVSDEVLFFSGDDNNYARFVLGRMANLLSEKRVIHIKIETFEQEFHNKTANFREWRDKYLTDNGIGVDSLLTNYGDVIFKIDVALSPEVGCIPIKRTVLLWSTDETCNAVATFCKSRAVEPFLESISGVQIKSTSPRDFIAVARPGLNKVTMRTSVTVQKKTRRLAEFVAYIAKKDGVFDAIDFLSHSAHYGMTAYVTQLFALMRLCRKNNLAPSDDTNLYRGITISLPDRFARELFELPYDTNEPAEDSVIPLTLIEFIDKYTLRGGLKGIAHKSPVEHIRRGYKRHYKNGKVVDVKSTVVNKSKNVGSAVYVPSIKE